MKTRVTDEMVERGASVFAEWKHNEGWWLKEVFAGQCLSAEEIRVLVREVLEAVFPPGETVDVVAILAETDHYEGKHDSLSRPWCPRCHPRD
jgi:hypothetical protein